MQTLPRLILLHQPVTLIPNVLFFHGYLYLTQNLLSNNPLNKRDFVFIFEEFQRTKINCEVWQLVDSLKQYVGSVSAIIHVLFIYIYNLLLCSHKLQAWSNILFFSNVYKNKLMLLQIVSRFTQISIWFFMNFHCSLLTCCTCCKMFFWTIMWSSFLTLSLLCIFQSCSPVALQLLRRLP